jgi:DNA-binding NarL/FixJ family response regulator
MAAIRVLVVDDQRLIRDGIASLLAIQDGIEVIGTAADGQDAVEQALALRPDVVLMDVRMPIMDGVTATALIRQQLPTCRVLMLTTFDDEEYTIQALRAGAGGYLLKDIPAPDLAQAVRLIQAGIYQLHPAVAERLIAATDPRAPAIPEPTGTATPAGGSGDQTDHAATAPVEALTAREREVLRLLATGATNREIAAHLVVSEGTVKNHVSSILGRLGLRDRVQAALYARDHGLL